MNLQTRIDIEKKIAVKLITDAIASGYSVSINDGEEYVVRQSKDKVKLANALQSTDEDVLHFHQADGKRFGWVSLIYGNDGFDVMSDWLVNSRMDELVRGAQTLATELERKYA